MFSGFYLKMVEYCHAIISFFPYYPSSALWKRAALDIPCTGGSQHRWSSEKVDAEHDSVEIVTSLLHDNASPLLIISCLLIILTAALFVFIKLRRHIWRFIANTPPVLVSFHGNRIQFSGDSSGYLDGLKIITMRTLDLFGLTEEVCDLNSAIAFLYTYYSMKIIKHNALKKQWSEWRTFQVACYFYLSLILRLPTLPIVYITPRFNESNNWIQYGVATWQHTQASMWNIQSRMP